MTFTVFVILGAIAGAACCLLAARLFPNYVRSILIVALAYIAAIYVGPVVGGVAPTEMLEIFVSFLFVTVAVVAFRSSDGVLAAGYIGHGLWDATHGSLLHAALPFWYAPMCMGFDWAVALWILLVLRRREYPQARAT